jgi:hypothetical protein
LALNVFQEFDLDGEDFSNMDKCFHKIKVPFKKEFKKVVHNNYIQKTKGLYIRGGIRPYTIFHNCNLKWDGSACQRVYMRV